MLDVYIPPFSDDDPLPPIQLFVLFAEAIARITPAFKDLRDSLLPKCSAEPWILPLDDVELWLDRWNLRFSNYHLSDRFYAWTVNLLQRWVRHPEEAIALRVDMGYKELPPGQISGDGKFLVEFEKWNADREEFETYAQRFRERSEKFLQQQKRDQDKIMERYGMKPYRKRSTGNRNPLWDFEWVALHQCIHLSDSKISAKRTGALTDNGRARLYPNVTADAVKKTRQRLEAALKFRGSDEMGT